jgi:hypothetical protein
MDAEQITRGVVTRLLCKIALVVSTLRGEGLVVSSTEGEQTG